MLHTANRSWQRVLLLAVALLAVFYIDGTYGLTSAILPKSWNTPWTIEVANLPRDVQRIRECRIQAFLDDNGEEPRNLLQSQQSFITAEGAVQGRSTCLVARERLPPFRILGTADLSGRMDGSVLLQNVFVAPEARGRGIAKRLVQEVERKTCLEGTAGKIVLSVDTTNTPAVMLYEKCAYQAKGIHAFVLGVSKVTGVKLQMEMTKDLSSSGTGNKLPSSLSGLQSSSSSS